MVILCMKTKFKLNISIYFRLDFRIIPFHFREHATLLLKNNYTSEHCCRRPQIHNVLIHNRLKQTFIAIATSGYKPRFS